MERIYVQCHMTCKRGHWNLTYLTKTAFLATVLCTLAVDPIATSRVSTRDIGI